ncbi:MAG: YciI family protein [Ginsengibacter sp.]
MTKSMLLMLLILMCIGAHAQDNAGEKPGQFDSSLAKQLGADDYGMKQYVMAFLKTGANVEVDSAKRSQLQMAHLKNIIRLANEGKLILAGPFLDNQAVRGIFIFNVTSIEEAQMLTESDPAVKAGVLQMEMRPWYGSAALMELTKLHSRVQRKSIVDE